MKEVYFLRHGQTEGNKKSTFLGWTDLPLNEEGLRQAECVSEKLKDIQFDKVYCSPLLRTSDTAKIILDNKFGIIYDDRLKERNFGIWDNLNLEEIKMRFKDECKRWFDDWCGYKIENGESALETYNRLTSFVDQAIYNENFEKALIISHLGCIRMMLSYLIGMGLDGSWRFRINNCGISIIEINKDGYAFLSALNY